MYNYESIWYTILYRFYLHANLIFTLRICVVLSKFTTTRDVLVHLYHVCLSSILRGCLGKIVPNMFQKFWEKMIEGNLRVNLFDSYENDLLKETKPQCIVTISQEGKESFNQGFFKN